MPRQNIYGQNLLFLFLQMYIEFVVACLCTKRYYHNISFFHIFYQLFTSHSHPRCDCTYPLRQKKINPTYKSFFYGVVGVKKKFPSLHPTHCSSVSSPTARNILLATCDSCRILFFLPCWIGQDWMNVKIHAQGTKF